MKIELTEGYYIRKLDSSNWVIAKQKIRTNQKTKKPYVEEDYFGYFATLQLAWSSFCDMYPLMTEKCSQIAEVIKILQDIKNGIPRNIGEA